MMDYEGAITMEPDKRSGRACIRGLRIAVADVLGWLASGMSHGEILSDFPELTETDIRACLTHAADRESRTLRAANDHLILTARGSNLLTCPASS